LPSWCARSENRRDAAHSTASSIDPAPVARRFAVESLWPSLFGALLLAAVFALHLGSGVRASVARFWEHRRWISAAAGVSVAYIFVDVLPELASLNTQLAEAGGLGAMYAEQRIYVLTLLSFVVMYGLQHIVLTAREKKQQRAARGGESAPEGEGGPDPIYALHLGGYLAYGALIGYLLVERAERGAAGFAVYVLAMGIHFIIVNHAMAEEHGSRYTRTGHWVLAAGVLAGWLAGRVVPIDEVAFARLFALLAGGVVITSLRAELPDERSGRFWPFCIGALLFAALLILA
jgi:hypothetical protein